MKQDYIITNYDKYNRYRKELQQADSPAKKLRKLNKKKRRFAPKSQAGKPVVVKQPKKVITRNYYLYALRLEDGYYYVGMTSYKNAVRRFEQHMEGTGAKWTRLHKPIEMVEVRDIGVCRTATANQAENLMTREYMNKYGMYKVRGGDLCYIKDALVALHFNDSGVKTRYYTANGKKISRSHANIRRAEKIQEQIARDLSWIYQ